MTRRTRGGTALIVAAWVLTASAVVVAGWWCFETTAVADNSRRELSLLTAVVVAFVVPAAVGRRRRPADRQPVRLVGAGIVVALSYFRLVSQPWAATLGALAWYALPLAPVDALVGRRTRPAPARWCRPALVALALLLVATSGPRTEADPQDARRAATWVFFDEPGEAWERQANPLAVAASDELAATAFVVWAAVLVAAATVVLRRTRAGRRWWEGTLAVAWVAATVVLAVPHRLDPGPGPIAEAWFGSLVTALPAMLAAVVGGLAVWDELVRPRLTRAADGTLELPTAGAVTTLAGDVARALGDPSARVVFPHHEGWIDGAGRPRALAPADGRAAVVVAREGRAVAAIEHDATLLEQPDLVDVTATTVALRLDAAVLTAEAAAAADDARASAARLLTSADDAGRALQATLAAGPDADLAALSSRLDERPLPLGEIHDGLRATLATVRAISHGVAPPALQRHGLLTALGQLADETGVRVDAGGLGSERLPGSIELTTYLLVAGAGSTATIARTDDGELQVQVPASSAIDQEVLDRVAALGGRVDPTPDGAVVVLPLAGEAG